MAGVVDAGRKSEIEDVPFALHSPQSSRQEEVHAGRRAVSPGHRAQRTDEVAVLGGLLPYGHALVIRGRTGTCLNSGDWCTRCSGREAGVTLMTMGGIW